MCQLRKFCLFVGCVFYAGVCGADVLDNKINELTKRRDELKLAISQCESKTNKFKIAGITTLGVTGVGIAGNVALHNKIQNLNGRGSNSGGLVGNKIVLTPEEKENEDCAMFLINSDCDSLADLECPQCS